MSKISELREKQAKIVADARALIDEITPETPEDRSTELTQQYDKAMAEYDRLEVQAKRLSSLDERQRALDAIDPSQRPLGEDVSGHSAPEVQKIEDKRKKAFDRFLRYGSANLTAEERSVLNVESRAQMVGSDTAGGFLVPDQFMPELIIGLKAYGPMNDGSIVRVLNTSTGATINWPTMDDTANKGRRIAENTQVNLTEVSFGTKGLDAWKYTSDVVLVSDEILQDAALGVDGIINAAMQERIGRIYNQELTTGNGSSQPNGIVTAASAGATAASSSAIVMDDLIELEHAVDPAYRKDPSVRWQFNDSTLKAIRKLKDGEGRYIWQPADAKSGAPATLLDYPYAVNQDMANIATGNRSVIFGAHNRYIVRFVKEFLLKRLVERYADYGQVGFIGFSRMDGELMDTKAVKALAHP